jgi:hypothetical protein
MKTLLLTSVLAILGASSPARAAEPPAGGPVAAPAGRMVPALVTLKDGQQLRGKLVSQDASGVTLELEGGARVVVPAASIVKLELAREGHAEVRSEDPNRTRYLYSPSGFMLRQGQGYVSQTELLVTSVAYGVTDHLTLVLGTSVPFLFVKDGLNLVGTVKVGGSLGEHLHIAGGAQGLWLPGVDAGTTAGFLFGTVTVGTPDAHLGLSAGPPFVAGTDSSEFGKVLFSVSGALRVSERIALVSENWFFPGTDETTYVLSGAVRFIGQRLGVDAGLLFFQGAEIPVPWLDFTWNFGT